MAKAKSKETNVEVIEETTEVVMEPVEEVRLGVTGCVLLNVRKKPNGDIIGVADFSTIFVQKEYGEEWTKVLFNGKTGYVMTKYIRAL